MNNLIAVLFSVVVGIAAEGVGPQPGLPMGNLGVYAPVGVTVQVYHDSYLYTEGMADEEGLYIFFLPYDTYELYGRGKGWVCQGVHTLDDGVEFVGLPCHYQLSIPLVASGG